MHIQKRFLLTAALALLPVDRCSAQFFTPVSTTMEAETWYFTGTNDYTPYNQATVQGPDDNENFGTQTGTLPASSQLNNSGLTGSANGTVTIDPTDGEIDVTLLATTDTSNHTSSFLQMQGSITTTITFDVPAGSGLRLDFNAGQEGGYNWSTSGLAGPDGLSWFDVTGLNIPSVPAGEYILSCLARTQTVTGVGYDGGNISTIQIIPEPGESALAIGVMGLLPSRRRRG